MKILVPSPVTPDKNSVRTVYISEVMKNVKKKTDLDFFWFIYQPDRINSTPNPNFKLLDIHDFKNALDCLIQIKPDYVMIGSFYEPIQYALSISCKKLKIPLISFYYFGYEFEHSESIRGLKRIISNIRNIFSSSIPSDSKKQKSFLRRLNFILYKIKFLSETQKAIGHKTSFIKSLILNFPSLFAHNELSVSSLPDLHILPDNSWVESLTAMGIPKNKICIAGSPFWDRLYSKSKEFKPKKIDFKNISILIITDALVEHGIWSSHKFSSFITKLVVHLSQKSEFSFSFKIHPASEDKTKYENLIKKLGVNSKIYQSEDVWDILGNFDMVLTFGFSTIHSQLSLVGVKTILIDLDYNFPLFPFVKEGIEYGIIRKCSNLSQINNMIFDFLKHDIHLDSSFISARENLFYKFDGKSAERISEAILNLKSS